MSLPENIKTSIKMKSMQSEEKVVLVEKIVMQAQWEPLQEKDEKLVMEIDATK